MRRSVKMSVVLLALSVLSAAHGLAQSLVGTDTCTTYLDATAPSQKSVYEAYLQGFARATNPDPRYPPTDATVAEAARKIHDWCGRNVKSSFGDAVYAVLGAALRSNQSAASAPATMTCPAPQQSLDPTSCRVGPTANCSGCSISCPGGKQASCKPGTDNAFGGASCTFQSRCECK